MLKHFSFQNRVVSVSAMLELANQLWVALRCKAVVILSETAASATPAPVVANIHWVLAQAS